MTYLRIQELAEKEGLNITTLSRRAKVSYPAMHKIWHGDVKQLNIQTLDKIAWALGVKVSDLFGGEPEEPSGNDVPLRLAA
ncbi:MAG: helix-turn-helix transcriptional regulator [Chloroflexaceae bacterium]|nr:helix-turn-helix transcriptional regulator [Chloroflexaceae bacterium]